MANMLGRDEATRLKNELESAVRKDKTKEALKLLDRLESAEPEEPRWPHRRGDLRRKQGDLKGAVEAYEKATALYAARGFIARAVAMAKTILMLDATRTDVLQRVDPTEARRLLQAEAPRPERTASTSARVPPPRGASSSPALDQPLRIKAAPVLAPAPAGADEVRFDDVEIDEDIEIELSDLDVAGHEVSESDADEPSAATLARLPVFPLLADAPDEALMLLANGAELIELGDREKLVSVGEPSDALYLIVEGRVECSVPAKGPGHEVVLGEGDVLGETCILEGETRRANAVSVGKLTALRIPRDLLTRVVSEYPYVGALLFELLTRRLLGDLLQTSSLFAPFEPGAKREIAKRFEVRRARQGLSLLESGKRSDGLYIPLTGKLTIKTGEKERVVGPGAVVGQQTLVGNKASDVTVTTNSDLALLRLPASSFMEIAGQYPKILVQLLSQPVVRPGDPPR